MELQEAQRVRIQEVPKILGSFLNRGRINKRIGFHMGVLLE
jgi:hypothetical protein